MGNCCLIYKNDDSSLLNDSTFFQSHLSCQENPVVILDSTTKVHHDKQTVVQNNCTLPTDRTYPQGYHVPSCQDTTQEGPLIVYKYAHFPFLVDHSVAQWIAADRVILIIRGLPGSGKSTLAEIIGHKFPSCTVCSQDLYFNENIDAKRACSDDMKKAESQAQTTAYNACSKSQTPIVIDDEHIHNWQYQYYLDLAQKFDYLAVIVYPKTPWRFDIEVLASKNQHEIGLQHIEDKLQNFQMDYPLYYGWFLSLNDSCHLRNLSYDIMKVLDDLPDIKAHFFPRELPYSKLDCWFSPPKSRYHVTAFFCQKGKIPGSREYADSSLVKESISTGFPLAIKSLFFTPRTYGARVELTSEALALLKIDDNEDVNKYFKDGSSYAPILPRPVGCRAHITLGVAKKVQPVQTGRDLLRILDIERGHYHNQSYNWSSEIEAGTVTYLGENTFTIDLNQKLVYETLYVGNY